MTMQGRRQSNGAKGRTGIEEESEPEILEWSERASERACERTRVCERETGGGVNRGREKVAEMRKEIAARGTEEG